MKPGTRSWERRMRIFKWKRLVSIILVGWCCGSAVGASAFADNDGKGKTEPPAKPAVAAKVEAPAPLTERERRLLDRVEQLEKRVADLEGKAQPVAASTSSPANSDPSPTSAGAATAGPASAPGAASPDPASPGMMKTAVAASAAPQAMERNAAGTVVCKWLAVLRAFQQPTRYRNADSGGQTDGYRFSAISICWARMR
jgi:hypothetical protein